VQINPTRVAVTRSIPAGGTASPDETVPGTKVTTAKDRAPATSSFSSRGGVSAPSRTVGPDDTRSVANATSRTAEAPPARSLGFRIVEPDAVEIRVLGCLIEKQRTTPDAYPLSLNALRLACNQSTNREPVVDYDERTIKAALERMSNRGWTRFASGASSRALKYRHLLDEALDLSGEQLAVLGILMLRGPQTLGELKQRSERLHRFGSLDDVARTLDGLAERELVTRLPRRPGQKEDRYAQLLGGEEEQESAPAVPPAETDGGDRLGDLERRIAQLEQAMEEVQARLAGPDRG
jgi:uncharacterized protein